MSDLDINWLNNLGYSHLTEEDARSLLSAAYSELEELIGTALSHNMSDEQLHEFGRLHSGDVTFAVAWVEHQGINPEEDELFRMMVERVQTCDDMERGFCDWAASKWLETHRPDYREVVARCREQLESELRENAHRIGAQQACVAHVPELSRPL